MKIYLLDTNVFISNPYCIDEFLDGGTNSVCVYVGVLEELDKLKTHENQGFYARKALMEIEKHLANKNILFRMEKLDSSVDDALVTLAKELNYILVSQDRTVRIKGKIEKVNVQDYESVKVPALPEINYWKVVDEVLYYKDTPIPKIPNAFDVEPKDWRQKAAIASLMDTSVHLVAITGQAGTGKNLLALAAGLEQVLNDLYEKIYVTRVPVPNGYDIGYLPGDIDEKLTPWLSGIYDNLDFLFGKTNTIYTEEFKKTRISILSSSHVKGASITKGFVIIDESQDIHPNDMKMLITRAAIGTKVVLIGDINQINASYLSPHYNGLSYVINKMHGQDLFRWIHLENVQRSPLAELAAKLL